MKKYYGLKEIKDIIKYDDNSSTVIFTEESNNVLKGDSQIILSNKIIAVAVTDTPTDATTLREKRCFPVVAEVLKVFLDWNVNISEVDFISQRVIMSINESIKKSSDILWGKPMQDQTMEDVHKVLLRKPEEKKEEGIPSPFMPNSDSK